MQVSSGSYRTVPGNKVRQSIVEPVCGVGIGNHGTNLESHDENVCITLSKG